MLREEILAVVSGVPPPQYARSGYEYHWALVVLRNSGH